MNPDDVPQTPGLNEDTPPPAKPIVSPQVAENRMSPLPQPAPQGDPVVSVGVEPTSTDGVDEKKSEPKKSASKKGTAKKTASRKSSPKKSAPKKASAKKVSKEVNLVAQQILAGSRYWGTGREQEHTLIKDGYNPVEVRAEVQRLRVERASQTR